jgi:hypothetical protein
VVKDHRVIEQHELEGITGGNSNELYRHYKPEYYSWMEGAKITPIAMAFPDYVGLRSKHGKMYGSQRI